MFKLLKFKNRPTKISLLLPVIAVILSISLSLLLSLIGMPMFITIFIIFFVIIVLVAANYTFIPVNDYLTKKDMLKYYFSRSFYNIIMYLIMMLACSLGINMISDAIIGTIFANINSFLGECINEIFLFLFTLFILSKVIIYNGYSDTTHKRYNPHIILSSVIFAFALVFPFVFADYLTYLTIGDEIFLTGFIPGRSEFIMSYISANLNLGYAGSIIGYVLQAGFGTVAMMYYYSEGRRNFFVKHPHNLEYDKEQIDSFIAKS